MVTRHINPAGLALVKQFEGCRLKAYPDPATNGDPWTIGYGSTGPHVHPGLTITQAEADALLAKDLARFEAGVEQVAPGATDNQFAALVAFAFNLGLGALSGSTLLKKHKAGDYAGAQAEFGKWVKAGGKVLPGLVKRRAAEAALYGS